MAEETTPDPPLPLPARLRVAADALDSQGGLSAPALAQLARAIVESLPEPELDNDAPLVIFSAVPALTVEAFGETVDLRERVIRAFAGAFGYQGEVPGPEGQPVPNPMSRARFVTHRVNVFIGDIAGDRFVRDATAEREAEARAFVAGALAQVGLAVE